MMSNKEEKYNSDFTKKVLESRQEAKEGKVTTVKKEDLKEFFESEVERSNRQVRDI